MPTLSPKTDEVPLPTRVLDLEASKSSDPGDLESDLRLMETAGQCGRYATLSYSWGGYKDSRTLRINYEDRKKGITYNSLPPVFQQAVKVTRGMGIRYLWIDALCIIQEDAEDWCREAALMSDVYWMSAVRLAVTDSKSPTEPFFPPKEFLSVKMPHLQLDEGALDPGFFSVLPKKLAPQTEEELVTLRQKFTDFLSHWRDHGTFSLDDDAEADLLGTPMRRRVVEEPEYHGPRGSAAPRYTRRDGNFLRKVSHLSHLMSKNPRQTSFDEQSTLTNYGSNGNDMHESEALREQGREHVDQVSQYSTMPFSQEDSDYIRTSKLAEQWQHLALNMLESNAKPRPTKKDTGKDRPKTTYLSMPRFYNADVDRGYLNSRGWVLQERLVAPRTVHFTKSHIYCEDNDDICGEDWVRQYFTWASCIRKESDNAQTNLFPERSHVHQSESLSKGRQFRQFRRTMYHKPESELIKRPWHNISQRFNECQLSFDSDRLAAIAGLVHRKCVDPKSAHVDGRNFCGLWEKTLHVDLAWFSKAGQVAPSRRILDLGLPSWSWLSYKGSISFVRDATSKLDAGSRLTRTVRALEFMEARVPEFTEPLPLSVHASLTLRVALRGIYGVSTKITKFSTHNRSREDLAKVSPFDFDPRTTTIPVALSSLTECQEILNENRKLVGFVAFDEDIRPTGDLFCAHISTLMDEAVEAAKRDLAKPGVLSVDMREYQRPILAYALVLAKLKDEEDIYTRVGLAEINYHWMTSAHKVVVKIR